MASKKELVIKILARNVMAPGLAKAGKSLKAFGKGVKRAAIAILGMGTAIAGVAVKAISAYAVQQKAEQGLTAALRAHGDEVDNNLGLLKQHAAAIQDETGAADESTLATMSRLRMLGVQTAALGDAARGVLALKSAGMEGEMAARALALAHQGNFAALNRYLPALRDAKTETEKAAIVNAFLTKGYAQQKAELNTVSGAWAALKGRVGDVWEEVGTAIEQNGALQGTLQKAGDAVKAFGARVAEWAGSGGVTKLIAKVKEFGENAVHAWNHAGNVFGLFISGITDGWSTAVTYVTNLLGALKNNYVVTFGYIKDYAVAVFEKIKHPFSEFKPPSIKPVKQALRNYVDAIKGKDAKVTTMTDAANKVIEDEMQRHIDKLAEINKEKDAALNAPPKEPEPPPATAPIVVAQENEAKRLAEIRKKELEDKKEFLEKQIALDEKRLADAEELAAKTVAAYIEEARAKENATKALLKDQEKADKLRKRQALGAKLSRRDREFLDAADKIKAAQGLVPKGQEWLKKLNEELVATGKRQETLLKDIEAMLKDNLTLDGGG